MYVETMQTVDADTKGWQTRLKELGNLVSTPLVAPSSLAWKTSDARSTTETKASGGESRG